MNKNKIKKIILAYSGGLDTSTIIPWLRENYNKCEVIAFLANIGQDSSTLDQDKKKAILAGASDCFIVDLREEFVKNYIYPILQTGALYEGNYLLGTAMSRPLIAKAQVELAIKLGADAVCHGCTGKGNDQVRFETAYAALSPTLQIIAPWREWNLKSREDLIEYLKKRNIPTTVSLEKIYSRDENAWHVSTEGGVLEDTWNPPNANCWAWTIDPILAPDQNEIVHIKILKGRIVAVNNENLTPFESLEKLNILGIKHGIGRIDIVENRLIGIKSRGCYETPGGTIIVNALRAIEQLVLDRESLKWRQQLGLEMSYIIYDGRWFSPVSKSIQKAANELSQDLTGEVVLNLYKGQVNAIQKQSINSLYSQELATFGKDEKYNHNDASGFIKLFSLSSKIRALKTQKK